MTINGTFRFQSAGRVSVFFRKESSRCIMAILAAISGIGLAGCSYVSAFPLNEIPDKSEPIFSSRMDAPSVHNIFGNPYIASRYWDFELYRDAASQTEVPIAVIIPFGMIKDDIYRYTLVSYNKDKIADSAVTGILRKPSGWRSVSPIEYNYLTIHLQGPDVTFVSGWEDRHETLLASPARRDAYLEHARLSPQSTVVVGCGTRGCADKLSIDTGPTLPLPCRLRVQNFDQNAMTLLQQGKHEEYEKRYPAVVYDTVSALRLAPGEHTLKTWGGRWQSGTLGGLFSGEKSISFSCRPGEVLYIVIDVFAKEYTWWGAKDIQWKIDLYKDMPEIFNNRHLVLYRGDQWLADPEQSN